MRAGKWMLGGAIGGAIGALVWAGVAFAMRIEVGYIAWGVGILAGLGVRTAAGSETGQGPGVAAALLAVLAVLAGKYAAVHFRIETEFARLSPVGAAQVDDNQAIARIADTVADESTRKGQKLQWPKDVDPDRASKPTDYPKNVWEEATRRWQAKSPAERAASKQTVAEQQKAAIEARKSELRGQVFKESFRLFDLLWLVLAVGSAYRIGSGQSLQKGQPQTGEGRPPIGPDGSAPRAGAPEQPCTPEQPGTRPADGAPQGDPA